MNIPSIPDNSLTEEIKEIVRLSEQNVREYGANAFSFEPPASEEELAAWENEHGISIPETYKDWLRFSNGSRIQMDLANFLGVQRIVVNSDIVPDNLVIIGTLVGDGELLCFSKQTGEIVRYMDGYATTVGDFKKFLTDTIRLMKGESGLSKQSLDILHAMAAKAKNKK